MEPPRIPGRFKVTLDTALSAAVDHEFTSMSRPRIKKRRRDGRHGSSEC